MKKYILIAIVTLSGVCGMSAQKFEAGGLNYRVLSESDLTVTLVGGSIADGYLAGVKSVVVPENVTEPVSGQTYTVVATEGAFYGLEDIEDVSLPNTITSITYDFVELPNLVSLNLPESLVSLRGFDTLPKLTELVFPESLQTICDESFLYVGLKEVVLPASVTRLGYMVFSEMFNLERIEMPGVKHAGTYVLNDCAKLKKLVLPPCFSQNDLLSFSSDFEEVWFGSDGSEAECMLSVTSLKCHPTAVYCARPVPPVFYDMDRIDPDALQYGYEYAFGTMAELPQVPLYVPVGKGDTYRNAPYWGMMDVREYDFSNGIAVTEADNSPSTEIYYDLTGRKVDKNNLAPGIYVSAGRKIVIR